MKIKQLKKTSWPFNTSTTSIQKSKYLPNTHEVQLQVKTSAELFFYGQHPMLLNKIKKKGFTDRKWKKIFVSPGVMTLDPPDNKLLLITGW